ncbi:galactokinase [Sphaeroforma arctica JP610]|uniref:Galactokinase n=1 Tax=Sphaeroforma arctica JP610 TaxID=667725 RepID=A0A0L0FUN7_9EUKA|nr:galactokinase [Sphaeroforma arctica JP610]KNC80379.1 galactokinase [Sphaeroforma arctica JP610]|eukprot:XP_014154281.1 galactokinase [Sphaeroforma arctica JP610]
MSLLEECKKGFEAKYGCAPTAGASAPGRVNIIGEHVDYCSGFVLPMALTKRTVVCCKPNDSKTVRFSSTEDIPDIEFELNAANLEPTHGKVEPYWENYVRGVFAQFPNFHQGMDAFVHSNVPVGGGLSSSAALEVAIYTLLEQLSGDKRSLVQKSQDCQKAENNWAGVPCGIMDQTISAMGKKDNLLLLDCQSMETRYFPLSSSDHCFVITNSNVKHSLSGSEYPTRRKQTVQVLEAIQAKYPQVKTHRDCTMEQLDAVKGDIEPVVYNRGRHVISEIARTLQFAEVFEAGDLEKAGQYMFEAHNSLSKDFEVSTDEIDQLVDIARGVDGVLGSRLTGGGFGGCTVTLVRNDAVDAFTKAVEENYKLGKATIFTSKLGAGAATEF